MNVPSRPCRECPWRKDVEPGQFPAARYEALRDTSGTPGSEVFVDAPMFGCHKSPEGKEFPCAGWLAVVGYEHLGVRLALAHGEIPASAMEPGKDWPELYATYAEMAEAMGA